MKLQMLFVSIGKYFKLLIFLIKAVIALSFITLGGLFLSKAACGEFIIILFLLLGPQLWTALSYIFGKLQKLIFDSPEMD